MASTKIHFGIKPLMVIILIVLSNSVLQGQGKDIIIKHIRETVQKINTDRTLKTIKLENEQISDEIPDNGLSLTGYVRKNAINKVDYWVGLSYCIRQYSFYLDDNSQLIFIYETDRDFPGNKQG